MMKPQKKAVVAKKATKTPTIAKKRRTITEKTMPDVKKDKKSKKNDKLEDAKKKMDSEKKKLEKVEEKKKVDDKKKMEDKKKERSDKPDEKKKQVNKDCDKVEEKKTEKGDDKTNTEDVNQELVDKKKVQKCEDKAKLEKQFVDNKKKIEKTDEKKKNVKLDDNASVEDAITLNTTEDKDALEEKIDAFSTANKKKGKDEKKKDLKLIKSDVKSVSKNSTVKDKKSDRKKIPEKDAASNKVSPAKTKKDSKAKQGQNKGITRKTVLTKKPHLSVVKRLVDKKIKLVKPEKDEEMSEDEDVAKKAKKKSSSVAKSKASQEKKPKLAKHMKAKLPPKHSKISAVLKREDKLKTITEKIMAKKKIELKETEEVSTESKKIVNKDEACQEPEVSNIKSEIEEDFEKAKEDGSKLQDNKKAMKSGGKISSKITKKTGKTVKVQNESNNQTPALSEDVTFEESNNKQPKVSEDSAKSAVNSKQEQIGTENTVELDLKVEAMNGESASGVTSQSDSEGDSDEEYKRSKQKDAKNKERANSPTDERARRMRLFGFWNAPKRHRVASLNALAKVHCLYENETGGVYLGGFCKPKPEKEREKPKKLKEEKEEQQQQQPPPPPPPRKEKEKKTESKTEDNVLKRKLRNVPGLRGKHWDMLESSSSSSSSDEDCEKEKNVEPSKKKMIKRRKKNEEVMDLKDMVVCKRMASLNATAILAASYSDEKNRCGSSSSDSSSDSEVEIIKRRRQNDSDVDKKKSRQGSDPEEVIKPSKKVVIVNQDTDVTITGVYVNQTRSTHHEGFCSIAGMQYRISSTSHTQTAATAVATELHDQQKTEQPCKSYTPLGALSSMQPPGSHQGNHPNMSPRRHSAFSAPHQHGYYQPAGPLIQHPPPPPPTLPPVKGPPPEPTPTPPQNSEGSDDLVATSTTSGGTSSTGGGFYRTYCPQYYGTPPQYSDLCYPPTYSHPHAHPPHYYKYAPTYRRQYYAYQETGGGGGPPPGSGAAGGGPGVVDYQPPPPPPGEYPLPPYYGGYPPHPPPPPNPAYLHSQGRPFVDPFQCPCPMQSCPKNVDTGALIGNGKGAPVVSGPGLSLPPSALVGPPSPARGLAGLAPPHGANAWDTDRVQINTHRNLNQNQQPPSVPPSHNLVGGHSRLQNQDCRSKDEQNCTEDTLRKCGCQNACTSTCEVKMETLSPTEKLSVAASCPSNKYHNFKLENNNVKCESCTMDIADGLPCAANCNVVKCESDYKCDIMKCEQCMKEGQIAIMEMDKDSGIVLDDKLDGDPDVKEELDVVVIDSDENWKKPDYEPTVQETVDDKEEEETEKEQKEVTPEKPVAAELEPEAETEEQPKCQKVTKRKLSLDSLSDSRKKRKLSKRALSVGSSQDANSEQPTTVIAPIEPLSSKPDSIRIETSVPKKKQAKKDTGHRGQKRKAETPSANESAMKKAKSGKQNASNSIGNFLKRTASDISIMETIDDVIQQSLQMTQKKDRKGKNCERMEKKKKKKEESPTMTKKVVKKVDQTKEHVANEKMMKTIMKNSQFKGSKMDAKSKSKIPQDCKAKGKSKIGKITEIKAHDTKSRVQDPKIRDSSKKRDTASKTKASDVNEDPKKSAVIKKKRKSAKKTTHVKKSGCKVENSSVGNESPTLTRKTFLKPKWNNGWSWEGEPFEAKVYLTNEETAIRRCYASMSHESGDVLRPRDCVLLKSGTRKGDLPYVAKIAALWENPDDGEMMFSLLWYYRPEHTEQGRTPHDSEDEVFASRHRDANSVACIEDKCYILTFNEYCRYRKNLRRIEEGLENPGLIVPPGDQMYPRENRQPPIPVPSDMVLFCRRVYDYRGKKLVKNPG